jgi:hypothetical protein
MPDNVKVWTTVGSAGTLSQADLAKVTMHGSIIQLGSEIVSTGGSPATTAVLAAAVQNTTQAVVRYNITPVDGLFITGAFHYHLQIRFRNHITARLMEADMLTGTEKQLIAFNSQSFPPQPGFQVQAVPTAANSTVMDFVNKAYYVEATLIASAITVGSPAEISVIKVFASPNFAG